MKKLFSPSMVVALVALFFAMGGTAIAAKGLITGKQIQNSSITGLDVKNKSLTARDFKGSLRGLRGLRGLAGTQGAQGVQGVQGVQGLPGAPGAPGEAVAFARVDGAGVLVGGTAQQKGITATMIQHDAGAATAELTGAGVYCIGGLGFTPKSAVVALDNTDALPAVPGLTGGSLNFIASVAIFKGEDFGRCDATHGQARVAIEQVNDTAAPTLANHGFFIWFE